MGSWRQGREIRLTSGLPVFAIGVMASAGLAEASACRDDQIQVRWHGGSARFAVEVADNADERSQGLMYREKLPASAGMLFVYERPQHAQFWMANTLIPLDMIFADSSGRVTRVHANAKPEDRTTIDGGEGVQFVLEINGGLAKRLGITEGAEMQHPSIKNAAWPCDAE